MKETLFIILGFIFLVKGSDILVDGASNLAYKFKIPELIVGLTIISIGTSMPELFVSLTSSFSGHADMSIGNIIGSNITNLLLILGISTMIKPIGFQKETKFIEIPMCIAITIIFMIFANVGEVLSRMDGIILFVLAIFFMIYTIFMAKKNNESNISEVSETKLLRDIFFIVLGIIMLRIGGNLVVNNSVIIARLLGMSDKLIGITILAIGTSLPELFTSVRASIKGHSDIAIGNIIGSCIFNILLILGVCGMIRPIAYNLIYNKDLIYLIISMLLLSIFTFIKPRDIMTRKNGFIYFMMYVIYIIFNL